MTNYASIWSSTANDGEEVIWLTKPKKTRYGPNLDKYIREGKKRRYTNYAKVASFFSISYYSMVRIAKEANACWKIRKTVIVDLDKLEDYLEKNCKGSESDDGLSKKES
ncbi:DUF6462 family protein [Lacrimispora amygdalina]|uniref:DUF6462 family protein n=1 Tax=Lacrimispora amygdalina TaxID=253257 RepID=UPI000BE2E970|nr:DUF6462 family protein [Lacrimispora amygdalina]